MRRHPSTATLDAWLDGDHADPDLDVHIGRCERCAAELERRHASSDHDDAEQHLADALEAALAVPDDLTDRLHRGVTDRLSNREVAEVVGELFGAGFETARLLFLGANDDPR